MRKKITKENRVSLEEFIGAYRARTPSAEIKIGTGLVVELYGITFTKRQIKNIKKYFA